MENTQKENCVGFLLINKPSGISSYDAIRHIKRIFKKRLRIGHAGTLDPIANGLLIVAIGRPATKELSLFSALPKCYRATAQLGILTDSLDKEGKIISELDASSISRNQIETAIQSLGSSYMQIPPVYAAVKYQGVPLYERARSRIFPLEELQKIAAEKARLVHLYRIALTDFENPLFSIDMCVSSGTYVRSVLNDIAQKVSNYATTQTLTRYAIGNITLENAIQLDKLVTIEDVCAQLLSLADLQERFAITPR